MMEMKMIEQAASAKLPPIIVAEEQFDDLSEV